MIIMGIDASTTRVGIALLHTDGYPPEAQSFAPKGGSLEEKIANVAETLASQGDFLSAPITVVIEDGHLFTRVTNRRTLSALDKMRGACAAAVSSYATVRFVDVTEIRKTLTTKGSGVKKPEIVDALRAVGFRIPLLPLAGGKVRTDLDACDALAAAYAYSVAHGYSIAVSVSANR